MSTTFTVVDAELFPGTVSGLEVVNVVVDERIEPLGAVTRAVTTRVAVKLS